MTCGAFRMKMKLSLKNSLRNDQMAYGACIALSAVLAGK